MMNASGINFKDHAGSMDLCQAALQFGFNVLKTGGHFVCKFYQGAEDKALEIQLKRLFQKVHRLKPESSRNVRHRPLVSLPLTKMTSLRKLGKESLEAYFIGLDRKDNIAKSEIFKQT
jgi:hypothetical protein